MICPECGADAIPRGASETLVGYPAGACGAVHNDNCLGRIYTCPAGHNTAVFLRRSCRRCEWKGKTTCRCHHGEKVEEWPR